MDDRRKIELIVAPIVVIVALILVFSTFNKVSGPKRQEAGVPTSESLTAEATKSYEKFPSAMVFADNPAAASAQDKSKEYDLDKISWGRDPFVLDKASLLSPGMDQDKAAKMEQLAKLKLTGMIISDENRRDSIAVINGENLKIGDVVSGFILKEIRQDSVLLEWGNEDFELRLWEEEAEKKQEPILEQQ